MIKKIRIPLAPISVNECWQGRRFKTSKYDDFIQDMLLVMPARKCVEGALSIHLTFGLPSLLRGDLDNLVKPVLDCMVKKGWIKDDRYINEIVARKVKSKEKYIEIEINEQHTYQDP